MCGLARADALEPSLSPRTLAALGTLAATVAAAALPLLPSPALADVPVSTNGAVFAADADGDVSAGLYRQLDGGAVQAIIPESSSVDILQVTSSQDGGRIAYVEDEGDPESDSYTELVGVRDAGGGLLRVFDSHLNTGTAQLLDVNPALSPDGSELVWTVVNSKTGASTLYRGILATGAVSVINGGAGELAWVYLTSSTLLTVGQVDAETLPVVGGSTRVVSGLNGDADGPFAVSPDGSQLAWSHLTSADGSTPVTADIDTASITVAGDGTATVGTPVTAATGLDSTSPTWESDGATLRFIRNDGATPTGPGDIWTAPANGSAPPTQIMTDADDYGVANVVVDTTAPGAATALPFTLAGTSAILHWTLPADPDLSGVSITRTGGGATKGFVVPAPVTSHVDTGLVVGTTYSYSIRAFDHSDDQALASTRELTAIAPFARFTDPVSTKGTTTSFVIGLPTVGSYTVNYRLNSAGPTRTWISHGNGASHRFALAPAGSSVALNVQSFDAFGNASAASSVGTATVPLDQTKASYVGKHLTLAGSDKYLGSTTQLQAAGSKATVVVNGNRLQVIGERCTRCGIMDVYLDGHRVAGVDTRSSARHARQVLYTRALTPGNHTLIVKSRGTAGRPNVVLDAFGIRH